MRRWGPPLVYALVTLAIAYPLLGSGYVFALDHAMGPESASFYARYVESNADPIQDKGLYAMLLAALDLVLPLTFAQKLLLFAPFFLAGLGMHKLAATRSATAAYFGGLVYALAPFAYIRAVVGQSGVVWAYALAPWFLLLWFRASETGSRRALAGAALVVTATAAFQAHGAFLLALLVGVHALVKLAREPRVWRRTIVAPAILLGWVVLLCAHWLGPVMLAPETTLDRIGEGDRSFFAMRDDGLPSVGIAAATLQGFWRASYTPYYQEPLLLLVPLGVLLLSVHAMIARRGARTFTLGIAGGAGLLLAIGPASAATAPLFDLAWQYVPGFRGFRDAHKLLALTALAYGYLGAHGADALLAHAPRVPRLPRVAPFALAALLLAAPLAAASPLLRGFDGQLGTTEYPSEWREAEAATAGCDGRMLVLPWHLYLDLSWVPNADKRITNPAKLHFSCPTLTADRVEAGRTASQSADPAALYAEHWLTRLAEGRDITALGNLLSPANVQYVLVLKEADWRDVDAKLRAQHDLAPRLENARVVLYENTAERSTAWRTDEVLHVATLDDLLPLAKQRALAGVAITDARVESTGAREDVPLAPRGKGYDAGDAAGRYLLFSPPAGIAPEGWRAGGAAPVAIGPGGVAIFDTRAGELTPGVWWTQNLPLWLLSAVGLAAMLAWARRDTSGARGTRAADQPA